MSRVGRQPILIPGGVTVAIDPAVITVSGTKGTLSQPQMDGIKVAVNDNEITVSRVNDMPKLRAKHGLMRALLSNLVIGVSGGFAKQLEINGVGYRVAMAGQGLKLNLGLSHDVIFNLPTGITAKIEQNIITINGFDKQQVGQVAADIRKLKKPEPYKGKGIKYVGERILRKSGKSGKEK